MNLPLIAGAGMALFGMLMFARSLKSLRKAVASETWPHVEGEVAEVHLWGKRLVEGRMEDCERLAVKYTYKHQGKGYAGSRIAFYTLIYPETLQFAQAHPAESRIAVHINPANAGESVLFPGTRRDKKYSDLIIASMAAVAGCVVAVLGYLGVTG